MLKILFCFLFLSFTPEDVDLGHAFVAVYTFEQVSFGLTLQFRWSKLKSPKGLDKQVRCESALS